MWDCGSKSNGSNLGKRALPWRMTVRSGLEGSTAAAVNDSTLIHGEGTFLAAARGATQLMKKQIFKANKLLNWLSNVQTSRKVGGPFFDRLPPPRRRSSFAELCVFIELLPPCICGRNPFDRIEVRVESHGGKGFLSPPLSSPHARVRTRTPGRRSCRSRVLCWPKNVVKGCVSRFVYHATSDNVFWPAEYHTGFQVFYI